MGSQNRHEKDALLDTNDNRKKNRNKYLKVFLIFATVSVAIAGTILIVTLSESTPGDDDSNSEHATLLTSHLEVQQIDIDQSRVSHDAEYRLKIAKWIMDRVPLIDGHNDFPITIRDNVGTELSRADLRKDLKAEWNSHTDIPRLREGKLGGQFWSIYIGCDAQYKDAVQIALEQIALTKSMIRRYPDVFQLVVNAEDIQRVHAAGRIASMLGMEGGHMIGESLGVLAQFYEMGVRYLTLTHNCNTLWADSCCDDQQVTPPNAGLTKWGKLVIHEMNRLGMLVDLSHTSADTMSDTLDTTVSPVIFSHAAAARFCDIPRNIPDHILRRMKENGGIVMMSFDPEHVNCSTTASLHQIADQIEYIREIVGVDHVGIGADFNGFSMTKYTVTGLEDVSKYPYLLAELLRRGWRVKDVQKVAGMNLIRVFKAVKQIRDSMDAQLPADKPIHAKLPYDSCQS